MNWTHAGTAFIAAFLASVVEFVQVSDAPIIFFGVKTDGDEHSAQPKSGTFTEYMAS